jgi:hypothetical protein
VIVEDPGEDPLEPNGVRVIRPSRPSVPAGRSYIVEKRTTYVPEPGVGVTVRRAEAVQSVPVRKTGLFDRIFKDDGDDD